MDELDGGKHRRLLRLKERLSLSPHRTSELLRGLGYPAGKGGRRTLERDLETLRQMGVDVVQVRRGMHRIPTSHRIFEPLEALSVYAAMRLFYHHAPTGASSYRKALESLVPHLPLHIRSLAHQSLLEVSEDKVSNRPFETAMRAWSERRPLRFEYLKTDNAGNDAWEVYTLEIYFMEVSRGNLSPYMIGHARERDDLRTFKLVLERIRTLELLAETYCIPEHFDPRVFLSDAWGVLGRNPKAPPPLRVRLRFDKEVAYLLEEGRYPGLSCRRLEDRSLEAEVMVAVDKAGFPREILPWVLSFGRKVRVLEPESLRVRVLEEARAMAGV